MCIKSNLLYWWRMKQLKKAVQESNKKKGSAYVLRK